MGAYIILYNVLSPTNMYYTRLRFPQPGGRKSRRARDANTFQPVCLP